ncbi:acyltransferase [Limosilactobacillus reuteri subsp. suis]|uniref:acyltransferase n=1 Tax=Limosilactobacillus reuteri TaxID=1598 RepID=UPI003995124D
MKRLLRYIFLFRIFIRNGYSRAEFLRNHSYFAKQGNHCYFQIYNFGTEPYLLSFGDNVYIASGVKFVSHGITNFMFNYMDKTNEYKKRTGKIVLGNNVFVGSNTILLYDVEIGDNVIIGAGSLVNKNIPSNSVVAGVPCKVIGSFEEYKKKIKNSSMERKRG